MREQLTPDIFVMRVLNEHLNHVVDSDQLSDEAVLRIFLVTAVAEEVLEARARAQVDFTEMWKTHRFIPAYVHAYAQRFVGELQKKPKEETVGGTE